MPREMFSSEMQINGKDASYLQCKEIMGIGSPISQPAGKDLKLGYGSDIVVIKGQCTKRTAPAVFNTLTKQVKEEIITYMLEWMYWQYVYGADEIDAADSKYYYK